MPVQTLDDLPGYLDHARRKVLLIAGRVPRSLWARRPEPGRWSVLDNLEHLVLTERFCADLLERMLERARAEGRMSRGLPVQWVDARPVMLDAAGKTYTAPVWAEPRGRWGDQEVAAELAASRRRLESLLRELPRYDVERVIEPHPLYGWPFNAAQWVHFVGLHENVHARQLERIARNLAPPGPPDPGPAEAAGAAPPPARRRRGRS